MTTTPTEPAPPPEVVPSGDPSLDPDPLSPDPGGPGGDPGPPPPAPETQPAPVP